MKKYFLLICSFVTFYSVASDNVDDPSVLIDELVAEIQTLEAQRAVRVNLLETNLTDVRSRLRTEKRRRKQIDLLIQKNAIEEEINAINVEAASKVSKVRYIKGIQIIKILYEKVLGLDHHFSSVRTFSEISKMANPNQYPEFDQLRNLLSEKIDRKQGFDLTSLLGSNPMVSAVSTISNMLVTNLDKGEKESELKKIECVLDFTLRMQNDLNTIFYETSFLHSANDGIKEELETLFKEYTKPIDYDKSIFVCRSEDDWDDINRKLESYIAAIDNVEGSEKKRMIIDIEFPIDRLIQFVGRYNGFINECEKFYRKFDIILNSYENESKCADKIPAEYSKLKADISLAIEKFNIAYRPVQINGTKMKEILYGITEYD